MRYGKQEADARALMNQGFLKVLNNLEKFSKEVPFEAWVKRIMINTIIDDFRKNRKVKELITYSEMGALEWEGKVVDYNEADKQFDAAQLEAFIRLLPPVSQKVFNLYAIDGYSHKEIGKMLGISDGTSKWHLSFARKKLQEMINRAMNSSKVG